jgi:uncharacterized membrane protein (DUF485 family)
MEKLKENLNDLSNETQDLAKDYLKYISLTASKKLALLIGILVTTFILSLLFLLVITLISFALAGMLNALLNSQFAGFAIVIGIYFLITALIARHIYKTRAPLFSNMFVKILAFIFEIDSDRPITLEDIDAEKKLTLEKIDTDKSLLKANFKLLKYSILETIISEVLGLFASKRKDNEAQSSEAENTEGLNTASE